MQLPIDARQTVTLRPMVTEDRINILLYLFVANPFGGEESRLVGVAVTAFAGDTCSGDMFATVLPAARLRLLPPAVKPADQGSSSLLKPARRRPICAMVRVASRSGWWKIPY